MPIPRYMPKYLKKRIENWCDDDYTGDENGYIIVTTAYGWAYEPHEREDTARHVFSACLINEAVDKLRWCAPCKCPRCQRGLSTDKR